MLSRKPTLLDLPLELFRVILVEAVRIRGLKRTLRLRLVSRLFSEEITEALCASGLSNQCNVPMSQMPFVRPYIEKRLLEHRTTILPLLDTVHKVAEWLTTESGNPSKFLECALSLLQLTSHAANHKKVCQLLQMRLGYREQEGFRYELLTAAAYTNNISLVKRLLESRVGYKIGALGNLYQAALVGRHFDIFKVLFEKIGTGGVRQRLRLLQLAAEYGDKEIVKLLLQPNWSLCKFKAYERRYVSTGLRWALQTPSIEIFNIIMQQREADDQKPLTPEAFDGLLRYAVTRGWVDMTRHIISLGVSPEFPAELRDETYQPLYFACKAGKDGVVKLLLYYQVHVSGAALEAAASHGHESTVKLLLEQDLDVHGSGAKNCVATAARKGYLGIVRLLIDAGMSPDEGLIAPMV